MVRGFTARYVRTASGYMGQLLEWPEVITEGVTLEECRESLADAVREMILACRDLGRDVPIGGGLLEMQQVEDGKVGLAT